jgi:hypothetical protein
MYKEILEKGDPKWIAFFMLNQANPNFHPFVLKVPS